MTKRQKQKYMKTFLWVVLPVVALYFLVFKTASGKAAANKLAVTLKLGTVEKPLIV